MDAPERIWLQWEDHAGESTWCQEPINDEDVEYVRADLLEAQAAQLQEAREMLRMALDNTAVAVSDTTDDALRAFLAK
jgi:hypothetical protein